MNKLKTENMESCKQVRREMGRHTVDCSDVQVSAAHGVIMLHGRVRPLRGHEANFETSVGNLLKALRARPGIRDVHAEWTAVF